MSITLVNVGAIPNDGTGDGPRTGISKVNGNFTDTTNAAAALVQTSATDTTAGRVLTTDRAGAAASPIFNDNNLNPDVFGVTGTGFFIGTGFAITTTSVFFFLPVSTINGPSSITEVGSFRIHDAAGTLIETTSGFDLSAASGFKSAALFKDGLTGFTIGETLTLRTDSPTSQITVNE